jgi:hypothetical protein
MGMRVVGRVLLWTGLLLAIGGGGARADFTTGWLSNTIADPTHPVLSYFGPLETDWTANLAVNKFDPNLYGSVGHPATLVGVDLRIEYNFDTVEYAEYLKLGTVTVTTAGVTSVTDVNGHPLAGAFRYTATHTASPSEVTGQPVFLTNPKTVSFSGFSGTNSYRDASTLSKFLGSGQVIMPVASIDDSDIAVGPGVANVNELTFSYVLLQVQYHFVPEPTSAGLTGVGLVGLAAWGVRARRRSAARAAG